ncbi:AAA family ATPase [Rhizobium leguminosarum]
MRASFAEAKEKAPSILFIDEIDVFGNRGETTGTARICVQ